MSAQLRHRIGDAVINTAVSGQGPVVLLLHGWPQTGYAWRHVVPLLAEDHTVVVPDLPGFGRSSKSPADYPKTVVAQQLHELMVHLGYPSYHVVGHDVGGQIVYPMAVRHRDAVLSATFVEAGIPGLGDSVAAANPLTGGSWHFGFNMVRDLPELLISGREEQFLGYLFDRDSIGTFVAGAIDEQALRHYTAALRRPGAITASLGHYRALPTDIAENRDLAAHKLTGLPVGVIGAQYGIGLGWLDTVTTAVENVTPILIDSAGHYLPEERPDELTRALRVILAKAGRREGHPADFRQPKASD